MTSWEDSPTHAVLATLRPPCFDRICPTVGTEQATAMVQESEKATVTLNLDELAANFSSCIDRPDSVFNFIRGQISHKKQIGKVRSSETYRSMLNSFTYFRKGVDLTFDMMDGVLMELVRGMDAEMRTDTQQHLFRICASCAPTTSWQ